MSDNALSKLKSFIEVKKLVYESNIAECRPTDFFGRDYNQGKLDFIRDLECLLNELEN